ncbi:UNVERIFIED_CONTAM: hypothetical protein FKN15_004178 [Acipenser sinensis]
MGVYSRSLPRLYKSTESQLAPLSVPPRRSLDNQSRNHASEFSHNGTVEGDVFCYPSGSSSRTLRSMVTLERTSDSSMPSSVPTSPRVAKKMTLTSSSSSSSVDFHHNGFQGSSRGVSLFPWCCLTNQAQSHSVTPGTTQVLTCCVTIPKRCH